MAHYKHEYPILEIESEEEIIAIIKEKMIEEVRRRLMSDRPIGCILSGGLDSTVVTAIVKKIMNKDLHTYTIGLDNATDLKFAKMASEHLDTKHHECLLTEKEFMDAIPETIYQIESYDTTTVRASVGNYLVSQFIRKEAVGDVVIYCGDVSDGIFGSYRGFCLAPNSTEFRRENIKMLEMIHYFDVLRSDKTISSAGLEARVPFAGKDLIEFVMSLHPKFKTFDAERMEKYILRKAFEDFLPSELIWRRKEAFSDGVSGLERSWFEIIQEFTDSLYTNEEYEEKRLKYEYNMPYDKESLYYREIFEKFYPGREKNIPYFWRHPFTTEKDPSARKLECY